MGMTKRLADYWADDLPESHREAFYKAACVLTDDFLDDVEDEESLLARSLPRKYLHQYTGAFLRRFFVSFLTVRYKLAQPLPPEPLLSCTAEELALHILIMEAEALLDIEVVESDFGVFQDSAFQDLDHEYLYDLGIDGIEDSELGKELGIGHFRFDEWFRPFNNAADAIHPYAP